MGWDFALTDELVIRPIGNLSLGVVESDATFAGDGLEAVSQAEAEFLDDGELRAYGYGGSLMLDWERYREDYLIDAELRYTHITIRTFDSSSNAVQGSSDAITLGFWGRLRVPTELNAFGRPLRALGEVAASRLIGDQSDVLRTDNLFQIGGGVEFDFGAKESFPITRGRVVGRYLFGGGATGFSLGLAVSF